MAELFPYLNGDKSMSASFTLRHYVGVSLSTAAHHYIYPLYIIHFILHFILPY